MEISYKIVGDNLLLTIDGHITGKSEVLQIKDIFVSHPEMKNIELKINDAFVIPSILLGVLVREIQFNKKRVKLICLQDELKDLIRDLNLNTIMGVD